MQKLSIHVTPQDIKQSARYNLHPLLYTLSRLTGTLWRMDESGSFVELTAPHRVYAQKSEPERHESGLKINLLPRKITGRYELLLKRYGVPAKPLTSG